MACTRLAIEGAGLTDVTAVAAAPPCEQLAFVLLRIFATQGYLDSMCRATLLHMRLWPESAVEAVTHVFDEILEAPVSPRTEFADGPPLFFPFGGRLFLPIPVDGGDPFMQAALKDVHTHAPRISTADSLGRTISAWPAPTNYDGLIKRFRPVALATFVYWLDGGRSGICERMYKGFPAERVRAVTAKRMAKERAAALVELPPAREVPALFRPTPAKKANKGR